MNIEPSQITKHITSNPTRGYSDVIGCIKLRTPVDIHFTSQAVHILLPQSKSSVEYSLRRVHDVQIINQSVLTFCIDDFYIFEIPLESTEPAT